MQSMRVVRLIQKFQNLLLREKSKTLWQIVSANQFKAKKKILVFFLEYCLITRKSILQYFFGVC